MLNVVGRGNRLHANCKELEVYQKSKRTLDVDHTQIMLATILHTFAKGTLQYHHVRDVIIMPQLHLTTLMKFKRLWSEPSLVAKFKILPSATLRYSLNSST